MFYVSLMLWNEQFYNNFDNLGIYHKWSLTICDGCFDTLKSSKNVKLDR